MYRKNSPINSKKPLALLIAPPVYDFALYDLYIKPYALLRIGKWLISSGFAVDFINSLDYRDDETGQKLHAPKRLKNGTGKFYKQFVDKPECLKNVPRYFHRYGVLQEVLEKRIKGIHPDIVFVSTGMTYWYLGVKEVCEMVKTHHPDVPLIVGGTYATLCFSHCRNVIPADIIISGPAFPELRNTLKQLKLPFSDNIPGEELLCLPDVLADAAVVRLNTGCPFRCSYCASHILTGPFTSGNPQVTFSLIEDLYKNYSILKFAFLDDALLVNKEKSFIPLLNAVIEAWLPLEFYMPNAVHISMVDEELAGLMFSAGFREVRLGFESLKQEVHGAMGKRTNSDELMKCVNILKRAGFSDRQIIVYIIAGLPEQKASEVEEAVRFLKSLKVKISVSEYSPVPLTGLWDKSVQCSYYDIKDEPLFHNNSIFPLEWEKFTRADMKRLKALASSGTSL
jgi:radical SAM superfamily enzyme YgiQ (UPF0313 family)